MRKLTGSSSASNGATSARAPSNANPILAAALAHARAGHAVHPLYGTAPPFGSGYGKSNVARICTCWRGASCQHGGKHPASKHGLSDATKDERLIRSWFESRHDLNLAIACGSVSGGLTVLDVDPRHGGDKSLTALEKKFGPLPRGGVVLTGSGGEHHYLQLPPGVVVASRNGAIAEGLDIKSEGGYVAAPPSRHFSGAYYQWRDGKMPRRFPPAPGWLLKLAKSARQFVGGGVRTDRPGILTKNHSAGRALAKLLNAQDRGNYWKFSCPLGSHTTPDASMIPRDFGSVYFKCWSAAAHTHDEIAKAVREMVDD